MEVSSKEEANACLQAAHIEEVTALANDIKGLKVSITSIVHMFLVANFHFHGKVFVVITLRWQSVTLFEYKL